MREDVTFGAGCAGWHYVADGEDPRPCVVMAHGFGGTRDGGLEEFADGFRAAGYDVLLFDYRGFGTSTGEPRQTVDFAGHREDYAAAITFARELDRVDADRIVLWGFSLAGGQVLQVAADDPRLAAVVSLFPLADGLVGSVHSMRTTPPRVTAGMMAAAARGERVPIAGEPGVISTPGMERMAGPTWVNEVDARVLLQLGLHRPGRFAKQLELPVLVQVADEDTVAPVGQAMKAAWDAEALVRHYPCDHFDALPGGPFHDAALGHAVDFLSRSV